MGQWKLTQGWAEQGADGEQHSAFAASVNGFSVPGHCSAFLVELWGVQPHPGDFPSAVPRHSSAPHPAAPSWESA